MTSFDRQVRAQVYDLLLAGVTVVDAVVVANSRDWDAGEVDAALRRIEVEHRLLLVDGTSRVRMAHPFSGVETPYRVEIGDRGWFANCAWDALALLALLGDGRAIVDDLVWQVDDGEVAPNGVIHLAVPARSFWDDVVDT